MQPSLNAAAPDAVALPAARRPVEKRFVLARRLLQDRLAIVGGLTLLILILVAVFAPVLAPLDPTRMVTGSRLLAPSGSFLFGTDDLGRDILSRVIWGARVSLSVGLTSVLLAGSVGIMLGVTAGYFGGWTDGIIMRIMDLLFAFPSILLALAIMAVLGTDIRNLLLAIAIVYIPTFARVSRASTLSVRAQPYMEAGRALGAGHLRMIALHVLPNIASPLLVQFSINLAYAILIEASLSFLGLGIQPPAPSWGAMLSAGKVYMEISPWPTIFPGLAIMLSVLGLNFLGDGLRDVLDPRSSQRKGSGSHDPA